MTAGQETAKIFVAKIPTQTTKEHIETVFQQYGPVLETKMLFHDDGAFRGCAFIKYETEYCAKQALGLNGFNVFSEDSQEPLVVRAAVDKRTYQKKKAEIGGYRAQQDQANTRQLPTSGLTRMNHPAQLGSALHYHPDPRTPFGSPDYDDTYWKDPQNHLAYHDDTQLPPVHSGYMGHGHGHTMQPIGGKAPRGQTTAYNQDNQDAVKYKHEHTPNHQFGCTTDHQSHGNDANITRKRQGGKEPRTTKTPSSYYKNQIQNQLLEQIGCGGGDVKKNKNNMGGSSSAEVMIKNSEKEEMYFGAQDWQNRFLPHWPMDAFGKWTEFAPALTDFTHEWTEYAKKLTDRDKFLIAQMMMNETTTMGGKTRDPMDPQNPRSLKFPQSMPTNNLSSFGVPPTPTHQSIPQSIPPHHYSMHQFLPSVPPQSVQQQQQQHLFGMKAVCASTTDEQTTNTQTPTENDGMGTTLYDGSYGTEEATTNHSSTTPQQQLASLIASTTYDGFLHQYPYVSPPTTFESHMSHPHAPGFEWQGAGSSGEGEGEGEGGYRTPPCMLIPSSMKMVDGAPLTASPLPRDNIFHMYNKGTQMQMMEFSPGSSARDDMTSFSNGEDVETPCSDNDNTSPRVDGSNSIEHASSLSVGGPTKPYRPYGVDREFASQIPCIIREYIDEYTRKKLHTR